VGEVVSWGDNIVGGGVAGHDGGGGEPCQGVIHALYVGVPSPYWIKSVVVHGWSQVPAFYGIWGPCNKYFRFFVYNYLGARQGEGCSIDVEHTIHVVLSVEFWGLIWELRRRFKVKKHCGSNLSQRLRGKSSLVEHRTAIQ
jgi:hypothetical protein